MRAHRTYSSVLRRGRPSRGPVRLRLSLAVLMFASFSLLVLSRLGHDTVTHLRWQVSELMTPLLERIARPLDHVRRAGRAFTGIFDSAEEMERLRDENQRLKGWEWRAQEAERKLSELSELAGVVKERSIPFVTSRVIAHSSGPFVRSAMLNVGYEQAIKKGYPVVSADGLVGRIVETGAGAAQVLLLTDLNSRIPVHVGRQGVRAIAAGDNGPLPRLVYLPADAEIAPGDEVATSGLGGLFPRGLRLGTVVKDGPAYRIRPVADLDSLDYLSVIFHETPTLGLVESTQQARGQPSRRDGRSDGLLTADERK